MEDERTTATVLTLPAQEGGVSPRPLPAGTRRLFPHYDQADLTPERAPALLIARLLEDGDAADLAWLVGGVPGGAARRLARRTRRAAALGPQPRLLGGRARRPAEAVAPVACDLWPL